jgi:hypothetical protein
MFDHYLAVENFAELETTLGEVGMSAPIIVQERLERKEVRYSKDAELIEAVLRCREIAPGLPQQFAFAIVDSPVGGPFVARQRWGYCIAVPTCFLSAVRQLSGMQSATASFCKLFEIESPDLSNTAVDSSADLATKLRMPSTPRQAGLGINCAEIAISFIINHEVAHILNGHLSLLSPSGAGFVFAEMGPAAVNQIQDLVLRQCLEWDADQWGITVTLGDILKLSDRSVPDWEWVVATYFAVSSIWGIFDKDTAGSRWGRIHPPPSYRALSAAVIGEVLPTWSAKADGDEKERLQILGSRFVREHKNVGTLVLWSLLEAGVQMPIEEMKEVAGDPGKQLTRALHEKWAEIYPNLVKLKIGTHNLAKPIILD